METEKLSKKEQLAPDEELWNRAVKLMPRGTQTLSKCPDQVTALYPKFADHAEGAYIYDRNGNKYLDFMAGLGPILLGYNHKRTNDAIIKQLQKGILFSLPTILEQKLAELIIETVPSVEQVRFAKNGTDATLASVRIARSYTGKEHIIKCGYHGWGDWHGIIMRPYGIPRILRHYIDEFEYNNLDSLEKLLQKNEVAAVIMEAQSLTPPNEGFLEGVRDLTKKYKALLIFDEVVTGYRWALGGAQEKFNVMPDLTCIGKAMANGMPISAIGGKAEFMSELNHAFFSMTFGGETLSIAAAIETIKELKEKDYNHIWTLGDMLSDGIKKSAESHGMKINFQGSAPRHTLSFSNEYTNPKELKDLFFQEMVKQGILWTNTIYVTFAHTEQDIKNSIMAADYAFKVVAENQTNVDKVFIGNHSQEIFRKST